MKNTQPKQLHHPVVTDKKNSLARSNEKMKQKNLVNKKNTHKTLAILSLLITLFCVSVDAQPPFVVDSGVLKTMNPSGQIDNKARQFAAQLGSPTSTHQRTRQPRSDGLTRLYQNGLVQWSPKYGAFAVYGSILAKWREYSAEQGELGFPVTDELATSAFNERDRYQIFEDGLLYWHANTNTVVVFSKNGTIGRIPPQPSPPSPRVTRGRFRVTVTGFTAHNQTWDHAGQVDGKDDEVYIVSDTRTIDRTGREITSPSTNRSQVMGDTNAFEYRVRAGSASNKGGIKSGDNFPNNMPWIRSTALARDRVPLLLWEGELTAGENAAVIIPTIWEWDGGEDMFTGWRRTIAANGAPIIGAAVSLAYGPVAGAATASAFQVALPATSNFLGDVIGGASDRPIGTSKNGNDWVFNPKIITLTYEIAENTVATDTGKGRGVIVVNYKDHPTLQGDYSLYIQIERLNG